MSKMNCNVINDLLPLYIDNVCSEESRKLIEEHLEQCTKCKQAARELQVDIAVSKVTIENDNHEISMLQSISTFWNRSKLKAFMKGIIIASLAFIILFLGYFGLFRWNIIPVSMDVVEITDVSQLSNGIITYHVKLTDGYEVNQLIFETDKDGNYYVIPYRPLIKSKSIADAGFHNMYYQFDVAENNAWQANWGDNIEIKALYFGTKEDNILIWEKGMELPPASEEVERNFLWE